MHSKISQDSAKAFCEGRNFRRGNTKIVNYSNTIYFYLHGNCIAMYYKYSKKLEISLCGWPTRTTLSRLNAIFNALFENSGDFHIKNRDVVYGTEKMYINPCNSYVFDHEGNFVTTNL